MEVVVSSPSGRYLCVLPCLSLDTVLAKVFKSNESSCVITNFSLRMLIPSHEVEASKPSTYPHAFRA
jgi:hypothetical protein